jgi:hypothetical protein
VGSSRFGISNFVDATKSASAATPDVATRISAVIKTVADNIIMLRQAATDVYGLLAMMFVGLVVAILLGVLAHLYSYGEQAVVSSASTRYGADPAGFTKWKRNVERFLKETKAKEEAQPRGAANTQAQEARIDLGIARETANRQAEDTSGSNPGTVRVRNNGTTASAIQKVNEASRASRAPDDGGDLELPAGHLPTVSPKTSTSVAGLSNEPLTGVQTLPKVVLKDPSPAQTGHHHALLVASVESVSKERDAAATVVRGFYDSLAAGRGDRAAEFVMPERRFGPFSAAAMTAFYGALPQRLQVISLDATGPNTFLVRYRFRSQGGLCTGRGIVSTVSRDGANYIASIQAPEGC